MSAESTQEQHDEDLSEAMAKGLKLAPREEFEALLQESKSASTPKEVPEAYDPLAQAVKNNPGLTYEEAEEMARAFGF